jgi:hypothetical protein
VVATITVRIEIPLACAVDLAKAATVPAKAIRIPCAVTVTVSRPERLAITHVGFVTAVRPLVILRAEIGAGIVSARIGSAVETIPVSVLVPVLMGIQRTTVICILGWSRAREG